MPSKENQPRGIGILLLAGFAFLLGGAYVFHREAFIPFSEVWSARNWSQVPCVIVESKLATESAPEGSVHHVVHMVYEYEYENEKHRGTRYHFSPGPVSWPEDPQSIVANNPPGKTTVCFVNPAAPFQSVLNHNAPLTAWIALPFGGTFMLIGVVSIGRWLCFWIKNDGTDRIPENTKNRETAPGTRFEKSQWTQLLPRSQERTILLLSTLGWNGIVSVFVILTLSGEMGGGYINWLFAIFLIPFVAIGLMLAATTAGMLARLLFGKFTVALWTNKTPLPQGESIACWYSLNGDISRMQRIRIRLIASEIIPENPREEGYSITLNKLRWKTHNVVLLDTAFFHQEGVHDLRIPENLPAYSKRNYPLEWSLHFIARGLLFDLIDEIYAIRIAEKQGGTPCNNINNKA
ncbi:MAG: DUF3592 domain-containing protein [Opitutaceae bacterium]|nr:DUF3592 domain-containing protein [Opitutaceae bacterium]